MKAVESAALKIQSTFRGKKFRSKKPAAPEASASGVVNGGSISTSQVKNQPEVRGEEAAKKKLSSEEESELNKRVAGIQVNDNSNNNTSDSSSKMASSSSAAPEATTNNNVSLAKPSQTILFYPVSFNSPLLPSILSMSLSLFLFPLNTFVYWWQLHYRGL